MILPKRDRHFGRFLAKGPYQESIRDKAIEFCRERRVAVDIGAHVGTWTVPLSFLFAEVHSFEPCNENRSCLVTNVVDLVDDPRRVIIHPQAVGVSRAQMDMKLVTEDNSGTWALHPFEGVVARNPVLVRPLDSWDLIDVDLIKIDVEGWEKDVLVGAHKTIESCRPVIVIELRDTATMAAKGFPVRYHHDEILTLLTLWGYEEKARESVDVVFAPGE